jgi:hypothetical protein
MDGYSDDQLKRIIKSYQLKRKREKKHYDKVKNDPEFKEKNCKNARQWYSKNYQKRQDDYEKNKDLQKAKSSYHYYKKLERIDDFKKKSPDKMKLLIENNYIKDQNPSSSTSTESSSSSPEPSS